MPLESREIRLRSRPDGMPEAANFEFASVTLGDPGPGEVQVRNRFLSVDPYMRGRMRDVPSYVPPFQLGQAMQGGAVGQVVASNDPRYAAGDWVMSMLGWREAYNAQADWLQKLDAKALSPETYLGAAGITGLTAYVGLLEIAQVKEGETVFVSGAAGAVGMAVCQIAKLKGATVIGSAGGAQKCELLREMGVDQVIDYKAETDLTKALAKAAPKGIHVYFDNVGGRHLEAAMIVARAFARIAACGMIANYNQDAEPVRTMLLMVGKRLKMQGFIVSDHLAMMPKFLGEMTGWIQDGKVTTRQTVYEGLDAMPGAFLGLFQGENTGKAIVAVGS